VIELRIAKGSGPTGRTLRELLRAKGIDVTDGSRRGAQAVVAYGYAPATNLPTLNAAAGRHNKFQQFQVISQAGVLTPKFYAAHAVPADARFPLFGRALQHREGKDIMLALQPEDVALRRAAGSNFFTEFVARETEYRIWVYRKRHLATYQKVMQRPEQYKYFGCSYRNGFVFNLVRSEDVPREAVEAAGNAVAALGLDFGAVDVLKGKDGRYYVLEVNTAPGVEGPGRQGIQVLADKIANWVQLGYPRRNGDTEAPARTVQPARIVQPVRTGQVLRPAAAPVRTYPAWYRHTGYRGF
jgi:peptidoglycan hydrolase-like protein with peptidoglycan-binding domain